MALDPHIESVVREAVRHAAEEYLVDIFHDDFLRRLSLHVQNLVHRAREQAWSRNPLTRSLKAAYPMVFEVAVSIASQVGDHLRLSLGDDEIAYIAMHVGGRLERNRRSDAVLTATIVRPGYYELHELLRSRIDRSRLLRGGHGGGDGDGPGLVGDHHRPRAHHDRSAGA